MTSSFRLYGILGATLLLVLVMAHPFLPGGYDPLAVTLSAMVQVLGATGLLLAPVGMMWLAYEWRKRARARRNLPHKPRAFWFALIALVVTAVPMFGVTMIALLSIGKSLALLTLAFWIGAVVKLIPKLKLLKNTEAANFNPTLIYLTLIPIALSVSQLLMARPLTEWSRNRAMAGAEELLEEIERHRANLGRYPASLLAVHKDYSPSIAGIERYQYAPHGDAYNLVFEQPRFLFDNIGTREFVVFNKLGQHLIPAMPRGFSSGRLSKYPPTRGGTKPTTPPGPIGSPSGSIDWPAKLQMLQRGRESNVESPARGAGYGVPALAGQIVVGASSALSGVGPAKAGTPCGLTRTLSSLDPRLSTFLPNRLANPPSNRYKSLIARFKSRTSLFRRL